MLSGKLRHQVILQSPGGTSDAYGERATTWTDVATVRAAVEPVGATERFHAGQQNAMRTHQVTIRYCPGIDETCRVLFGSRALVIVGVRNLDEKNVTLMLDCVEDKRKE
jgi:SPP1 family predicted phage head-tail adaptor